MSSKPGSLDLLVTCVWLELHADFTHLHARSLLMILAPAGTSSLSTQRWSRRYWLSWMAWGC